MSALESLTPVSARRAQTEWIDPGAELDVLLGIDDASAAEATPSGADCDYLDDTLEVQKPRMLGSLPPISPPRDVDDAVIREAGERMDQLLDGGLLESGDEGDDQDNEATTGASGELVMFTRTLPTRLVIVVLSWLEDHEKSTRIHRLVFEDFKGRDLDLSTTPKRITVRKLLAIRHRSVAGFCVKQELDTKRLSWVAKRIAGAERDPPALRRVVLSRNVLRGPLDHLNSRSWASVTELSLRGCPGLSGTLAVLEHMPALERLDLSGGFTAPSPQIPFASPVQVGITGTLEPLLQCPQLAEVRLGNLFNLTGSLPWRSRNDTLKVLDLSLCLHIGSGRTNDSYQDLAPLAQCPALQVLILKGCSDVYSELTPLCNCPDLQILDIGDCEEVEYWGGARPTVIVRGEEGRIKLVMSDIQVRSILGPSCRKLDRIRASWCKPDDG